MKFSHNFSKESIKTPNHPSPSVTQILNALVGALLKYCVPRNFVDTFNILSPGPFYKSHCRLVYLKHIVRALSAVVRQHAGRGSPDSVDVGPRLVGDYVHGDSIKT